MNTFINNPDENHWAHEFYEEETSGGRYVSIGILTDLIKRIAKKVISKIKNAASLKKYHKLSYSQEGEDMLLSAYFGKQQKGYYVDIGSYHPKQHSNTYHFYKRGWRGINIDPNRDMISLFNKCRPNDTNLSYAVGKDFATEEYYVFNHDVLNTIDKESMEKYVSETHHRAKVIGTYKVKVVPLSFILDSCVPQGQKIDFFSIDCQGNELKVLETNDWNKYRPRVIIVEIDDDLEDAGKIGLFLDEKGYKFWTMTGLSKFFILK